MLKAIIFDMDGVITNTEPQHKRALQRALEHYDLDCSEEYCEQFIGSTQQALIHQLQQDFKGKIKYDEFLQKFSEWKKSIHKQEGYPPVAGIYELLSDLKEHNVTLAIASSSTKEEILNVIDSLHIKEYFSLLVSGSQVTHSKPAPDIFLFTLQQLNCTPEECIIIEDSKNGTLAAKKANIACIGYQNPDSGNQDLSAANVIIETLSALDYDSILEEFNHANGIPHTYYKDSILAIRELSYHDFDALYQMYQSQKDKSYLPLFSNYKEEQEKHFSYIKECYQYYRFGLWGIFDINTNQLIGHCGFQLNSIDDSSEIELSYFISENHRNQGLAKRCIHALLNLGKEYYHFSSIVCCIEQTNQRSINLIETFPFIREKELQYNGKTCFLYRFII